MNKAKVNPNIYIIAGPTGLPPHLIAKAQYDKLEIFDEDLFSKIIQKRDNYNDKTKN